jgi:hypothetical protein
MTDVTLKSPIDKLYLLLKYHNYDYSPEDKTIKYSNFLSSHKGNCIDFINYSHYYLLDNNIEHKCYYSIDSSYNTSHYYIVAKYNNEYYWIESAWSRFSGIHKYRSYESAVEDIRSKLLKYENNNSMISNEYAPNNSSITYNKYMDSIINGELM